MVLGNFGNKQIKERKEEEVPFSSVRDMKTAYFLSIVLSPTSRCGHASPKPTWPSSPRCKQLVPGANWDRLSRAVSSLSSSYILLAERNLRAYVYNAVPEIANSLTMNVVFRPTYYQWLLFCLINPDVAALVNFPEFE